jgi:hypothetical protein
MFPLVATLSGWALVVGGMGLIFVGYARPGTPWQRGLTRMDRWPELTEVELQRRTRRIRAGARVLIPAGLVLVALAEVVRYLR